jgi:2-aminoethylphosphonate-pyruvate transaminase
LNLNCIDITCDETEIPNLDLIEELLVNDKQITHFAFIHSETTTGIVNPIEPLCKLAKKYEKIIIVDAMSRFI